MNDTDSWEIFHKTNRALHMQVGHTHQLLVQIKILRVAGETV